MIFCQLTAQKIFPLDSAKLAGAGDLFADDYGSIYLYRNQNFSFTKYDSLGKERGRLMLTVPYKMQDVQNPLNIVLFSENAQQMKFVDQNLNEIQQLDLRRFGFIKMVYAEDLQQIWLLDASSKNLLQYNFREDRIINSYPFMLDFEKTVDMMIFQNRFFLLSEDFFRVYDFRRRLLYEKPVAAPKKLRRENEEIFVISSNSVSKFLFPNIYTEVFRATNTAIVDKNSAAYFELTSSKLYLYQLKK